MAAVWRWSAVWMLVVTVLCASAAQDVASRRYAEQGTGPALQGHSTSLSGGGMRVGGRHHRGPQVEGEGGRLLTREERRRLREERRQARLVQREERRRQKQDGRREESAGEDVEQPEEEVDLVWLRANLSSLWHEFRAFRRQQHVRGLLVRGAAGERGHVGARADGREEEASVCITDVSGCRDYEGSEICSGHGECECGHCRCQAEYYGRTCQCSDHTCQLYDGMPCGGPSRGQCRCGECMCRPNHVGEDCSCPTHTHTCIQPGDVAVCSDQGVCECGRCQCGDGYKGMYCEDSVYAARVCETLKACVLCKAWGRELAKCQHCEITISVVDMLEPSMTTCVMVNSGCILKYSYVAQTANAYSVLLEMNAECPPLIQ